MFGGAWLLVLSNPQQAHPAAEHCLEARAHHFQHMHQPGFKGTRLARLRADPEAADFALGQGAAVRVVGLDVTHSCLFTGAQLAALAGRGRFGSFLAAITGFYLQYHRRVPSVTMGKSGSAVFVQPEGDKLSGSGRFV